MEKLLRFILEKTMEGRIEKQIGLQLLETLRARPEPGEREIAIIGMACNFPKSPDPESFWSNLTRGTDCVRPCPEPRVKDALALAGLQGSGNGNPVVPDAAYLDEVDRFDPEFFRISPREASLMDPHQRLFLQTACAAIDNAGYGGKRLKASNTGVFVGFSDDMRSNYAGMVAQAEHANLSLSVPGNLASVIAGRVAHHLDLRGPALVVDTACSSSLVAVHLACRSLRSGECAQAIAGGVRLSVHPVDAGVKIGIESGTFRTRSFDDSADGTGFGEGVGALLLKPLSRALEDGDHIWAVIKGSAINQDGESAGITVPNLDAQARVLRAAWEDARVDPETIGYIEAHGTGTSLGDPIEIEGIRAAFAASTRKKQFCAIGSVKSNIGHLFEAPGIAGLIKAILSLHAGKIPPSIGFATPNRRIAFEDSPVYVNDVLQNWNPEGAPLRCGVSAFGFSGTNAHMVLEAAPPRIPIREAGEARVFVLSAKTLPGLLEAAERMLARLFSGEPISLDSLCFTLSVGRGHYSHRLAMEVESLSGLRERLVRVAESGLENGEGEGVFYGRHSVVFSGGEGTEPGTLTPGEAQSLSAQAASLLAAMVNGSADSEDRKELCRLYVRGAEVEWDSAFASGSGRVIPLPGYPFRKTRCWVRLPGEAAADAPASTLHPLLGHRRAPHGNEESFRTDIRAATHWIVSDHRVMGYPVVPGFAYPEMAAQIARHMGMGGAFELRAFSFHAPVILEDDADVAGILAEAIRIGNGLSLSVTAFGGRDAVGADLDGRMHVKGEIHPLPDSEIPSGVDITAMLAAFPDPPCMVDVNVLAADFIEFGPRWTHRHRYWSKGGIAVAELELAADLESDLKEYILHPGLLDMGVNTMTLALANEASQRYLPFSFGSMKVFRPLPGRFYCRIETGEDRDDGETIHFNVDIYDAEGRAIAAIRDYSVKKVRDSKWLTPLNGFHRIAWIPKAVSVDSTKAPSDALSRPYLIIHGGSAFARSACSDLAALGCTVLEAESNPEAGAVWEAIIRKERVGQVAFFADQEDGDLSMNKDGYRRLQGHVAVLRLAKILAGCPGDSRPMVSLIVKNAHMVTRRELQPNPIGASLLALGEVIAKENPGLRCLSLDVDGEFRMASLLVEIGGTGSERQAAYRENVRHVEELQAAEPEASPLAPFAIKGDGAYIITGGTGGLGLEMGKTLAGMGAKSIHLLSRTGAVTQEMRPAIAIMEAAGSVVESHVADVCLTDRLAEVMADIRGRYGKISGVVHAAGIAGSGFLALKSEATFLEVLAPKISGTLNLHELTKDDPLDLFVLFSSVASLLGLPGQGDYSSASAFLDSFAAFRRSAGRPALSIGWPAWKEAGMAVREGNARDTLFAAITNLQGKRALASALRQRLAHVWVGEFRPAPAFLEFLRVGLGKNLHRALASGPHTAAGADGVRINPVALKGRENGIYSDMEMKVGACWGMALGYAEIHVASNFYELGGDSLMAMKVVDAIVRQTGIQVSVPEIFRYPTIAGLSARLDGNIGSVSQGGEPKGLRRAAEKVSYAASPSQRAVYAQEQFEGVGTAYNLPFLVPIEGATDRARVKSAFLEVVRRQEVLRTAFEMRDGEVVQLIQEDAVCEFTFLEAAEKDWKGLIRTLVKPFDLARAPLVRGCLFESHNGGRALFVDMHHIIADGISIDIFIRDFAAIYRGDAPPLPSVRYRDFSELEERRSQSGQLENQFRFWRDALNGDLPEIILPWDANRGETRSFSGGNLRFGIGRAELAAMAALAKSRNTTLNDVLFAIYALVLHKYGEQDEVVIGSLVAGRNHPGLHDIMGMFNNYLPIRCRIDSGSPFLAHLDNTKRALLDAFENQEFPYSRMVEAFHRRTDPSRNPFFDVMLIFHGQFDPVKSTPAGPISLRPFQLLNESHSKLDMRIDVTADGEGGLSVFLEYNAVLFQRRTMDEFSQRFLGVLEQVISLPEIRIGEVDLATREERRRISVEFNDTRAPFPDQETLDGIFAKKSGLIPRAQAATFADSDAFASLGGFPGITYSELLRRADALAGFLVSRGLRTGDIVAVMAERSLGLMVGLLGIMRAGGAYLPVDPAYPLGRRRFMIEDSGARFLLSQGRFLNFPEVGCPIVDLESGPWGDATSMDAEFPEASCPGSHGPLDLAYVIYTSGSTGNHKGALIEHRSIVNRLHWMQKAYPLSSGDVILQKTPFTFDVSVWEFFWWFLAGASVHFLAPGEEKDPAAIAAAIRNRGVTVLHFVPPMLRIFLEYLELNGGRAAVPSLKRVFCSGDVLHPGTVRSFYGIFGTTGAPTLHNLYGPTEAAVDVTYFDCPPVRPADVIPIGRPIDNTRIHILGKDGKARPIGLPGELYISGTGVGRGYLRQESLTARKFLPDPFHPGERMYRTGDSAFWNRDGQIEFLGRLDFQVKIRGNRVELGEIERRLSQYPGVEEALVLALTDGDGDVRLCAYFVAKVQLAVPELKYHMLLALPEYMVPAHFIRIPAMPLTANGKSDRKALPKPGQEGVAIPESGHDDAFAVRLLPLAREVLKVESLTIDDDFFEMGGHSLKAASFALKIQKRFGKKVGLARIFSARTLRRLARDMSVIPAVSGTAPGPERVPDRGFHPASWAQIQIFLSCKMEGPGTAYNLPVALLAEGDIDMSRFRAALGAVAWRHEPMRTSFSIEGGRPVQIIHQVVPIEVEEQDMPGADLDMVLREFVRPFRLDKAPLFRSRVVRTARSRYWVLFDFHHIISDGVSMSAFIRDFKVAYEDGGPGLTEVPLRFRDYAEWQLRNLDSGAFAAHRSYWLGKLSGPLPVLDLHTDFPRPRDREPEGASIRFHAQANRLAAYGAAAAAAGTTLYAFLMAGYAVLLSAASGQEDLLVAMPMAARIHPDLEPLIGMFVNTLVLRALPVSEKRFREFLSEVSADVLEAAERQEFPLESLLGDLQIAREPARTPLYETLFVLQNMSMPAIEADGLKITRMDCGSTAAKLDLSLFASEESGGLAFHFEYRTTLFARSTVESMAGDFLRILDAAAANPELSLRVLTGRTAPDEVSSGGTGDFEFTL